MAKNFLRTLFVSLVVTSLALLLNNLGIKNESIIMLFLLGVLFTSLLTRGRYWGMGVSFVYVILFDFLFIEPTFTFHINYSTDLLLLFPFLITAVLTGNITSQLQKEMDKANENERTANTLYLVSSELLSVTGEKNLLAKSQTLIKRFTSLDCHIIINNGENDINTDSPDTFAVITSSGVIGHIIVNNTTDDPQKKLILQSVCTQLGIALEREELVEEREKIRLQMESEKQRSTLLRSVAHDLRSPLTALGGESTLLSDNYDNLSDTDKKGLISDIAEETVWMTDLVENILSMTRISERKLIIQKQDEVIDDIVYNALSHTKRLLGDRKINVILPKNVITVNVDGMLINQVLVNLLENAARHTPLNSEITISAETEGKSLRVSVIDTGDGVNPELKKRMFEPFVSLDDKIVDGKKGLGLGLSICKAIVQAHGGTIEVRDNNPHGSDFTFTLPMEV
jgi:two-component system sensor histidine kinase KdpD